jgi:hypothetical protein
MLYCSRADKTIENYKTDRSQNNGTLRRGLMLKGHYDDGNVPYLDRDVGDTGSNFCQS